MLLTTADATAMADGEVCALIMRAPYGDIVLTSFSPIQQEKAKTSNIRPVKVGVIGVSRHIPRM